MIAVCGQSPRTSSLFSFSFFFLSFLSLSFLSFLSLFIFSFFALLYCFFSAFHVYHTSHCATSVRFARSCDIRDAVLALPPSSVMFVCLLLTTCVKLVRCTCLLPHNPLAYPWTDSLHSHLQLHSSFPLPTPTHHELLENAFLPTCPKGSPGCVPGNQCLKCPAACATCLGHDMLCKESECLACKSGYALRPIAPGVRFGSCHRKTRC